MLSLSISNNIVNILNSSLGNLPSPYFINYFWNIGSLLGLVIISQIIYGILVSIFFISDTRLSFYSVIWLEKPLLCFCVCLNIEIIFFAGQLLTSDLHFWCSNQKFSLKIVESRFC